MPLHVQQFLEQAPALVRLRDEAARAVGKKREEIESQLADVVEDHRRRWEAGGLGWMTVAEAQEFVSKLNGLAGQKRRKAKASVEPIDQGGHLVFTGGAHGPFRLDISATSPVRALVHWKQYLEDCPPSGGASCR